METLARSVLRIHLSIQNVEVCTDSVEKVLATGWEARGPTGSNFVGEVKSRVRRFRFCLKTQA